MYEPPIVRIRKIMLKLKNLVLSPKLRQVISLRPKIRNTTLLSSCYGMTVRYTRIRHYLSGIKFDEINSLSLSSSENRKVDGVRPQIQSPEAVTNILRDNSTTMSHVRTLFDAVVDKVPITSNRMISSASIIY